MTKSLAFCWAGIAASLAYRVLAGCGSCQYPPGPQPATGGSPATGGMPGTGGAGTGGSVATGGTGGVTTPSEAELVCSHLDGLGCPEGDDPTCPLQITKLLARGRYATFDSECLLLATTQKQVRDCGSVLCRGDQ